MPDSHCPFELNLDRLRDGTVPQIGQVDQRPHDLMRVLAVQPFLPRIFARFLAAATMSGNPSNPLTSILSVRAGFPSRRSVRWISALKT